MLNITKRTKKATKRTCERYQYLPKKEKEKQQQNFELSDINISLEMKNNDWLNAGKNIAKWEKDWSTDVRENFFVFQYKKHKKF